MLELTPEAAARVVAMREVRDDESAALFLRVWRDASRREAGVRIGFVRRPYDDDQLGISQGVPMCVGAEVAELLDGMVIDSRPDEHTPLFIRAAD